MCFQAEVYEAEVRDGPQYAYYRELPNTPDASVRFVFLEEGAIPRLPQR